MIHKYLRGLFVVFNFGNGESVPWNLTEYRKHPRRLADHLPWAALIGPGVILNKDGSFQKTIRFRGPDLDSSTSHELIATRARLNNVLRRFGSNWCIHVDATRRYAMEYPASPFPNRVAELIDMERSERFTAEAQHFESQYHLTFTYLPPPENVRTLASLFLERSDSTKGRSAPESMSYRGYYDLFMGQVEQVVNLLVGFMPEVHPLNDAETLAYLHGCVSDRKLRMSALHDDPAPLLPKIVEVKVPVVSPQLRPLSHGPTQRPAVLNGPDAIAQAKATATTQPTSDGFLNATQYYDYAPGMVYTVVTSPGYVTSIQLRPAEKLITASAGDTTRWVVESVESGSGDNHQTLLLIKPRRPFLQTNLVITTDQRVYTLDLTSTDQPVYHTLIAWNYPFGDVVAIRNRIAEEQARQQATIAAGLDLAKVDFDYLILRQKHEAAPPWCPLRAFDDGAKTYIQFPPKVTVTEAPPLFVLGSKGDAEIVNYRVKGDYYVVDRLFDRAELRLGEKPQMVVGIQRASVK